MLRKIAITVVVILAVILVMFNTKGANSRQKITLGSSKLTVEVVDNPVEQARGLSGRRSLCDNCGMLFVYPKPQVQNFWMKGMAFPLDFVFIRDGRVVEVVENISPLNGSGNVSRVQSREEADRVLEVNAEYIRKHGVKVGDPAI